MYPIFATKNAFLNLLTYFSVSECNNSAIILLWKHTEHKIFQLPKKNKFEELGQTGTPLHFRKNTQVHHVSSLVFFYSLKIDHRHFLYVQLYFSPWIIQLMEFARNAFIFTPHIHLAQKITTKKWRRFIILSKILQVFLQFDLMYL